MSVVGFAHLHFQALDRPASVRKGCWPCVLPLTCVNIKLNPLVTSVSAALVQLVSTLSLVATGGQSRSPADVVVFFFPSVCHTACVSLSPSVWKSHPSFSQEIPLCPRGKTHREGVKEQRSRSATEGHSRPWFLI